MERKSDISKAVEAFQLMKGDYAFREDIMTEDSAMALRLKKIIQEKLSIADRTIIIMYADFASLRKLAKALGVSHTTASNEIKRIRNIIMKEL